jgi:hypothetical protein
VGSRTAAVTDTFVGLSDSTSTVVIPVALELTKERSAQADRNTELLVEAACCGTREIAKRPANKPDHQRLGKTKFKGCVLVRMLEEGTFLLLQL